MNDEERGRVLIRMPMAANGVPSADRNRVTAEIRSDANAEPATRMVIAATAHLEWYLNMTYLHRNCRISLAGTGGRPTSPGHGCLPGWRGN